MLLVVTWRGGRAPFYPNGCIGGGASPPTGSRDQTEMSSSEPRGRILPPAGGAGGNLGKVGEDAAEAPIEAPLATSPARAGMIGRAAPTDPVGTEKAANALVAIMWRIMRRI